MTFSLKKTISRIQARRRSTNSDVLEVVSPSAKSPPRLSMPILPSATEPNPLTRPALGDLFSASLASLEGSRNSITTTSDSEITTLKTRVAALEEENSVLQSKILSLTLEAQIREEELSKFRSEYYAEISEAIIRRREATATQERLDQKLARYQRFISSIVEVGLHDPVLSEAWLAVKSGQPADEALVDSIKKAASRSGTSWSTIIPAVHGPRTPEHYLSAINLTLKTRRELKKATQVGLFWKKTAKKDMAHKNTVTPSSSDLSDFSAQYMPKPEESHTAVDDLLAKLKSDDPPLITTMKDSNSGSPKVTETISVPTSSSSSTVPASVSFSVSLSISLNESTASTTSSHSSEIVEYPPGQRVPTFSQNMDTIRQGSSAVLTKHSRPVLRSIDLNCDGMTVSATGEPSHSTKAFGKQKLVLPSLDDVQSDYSNEATHTLQAQSPPLTDNGILAAERALLSLERICARFSSGSLGSLGTIAGDSTNHIQTFGSAFTIVPSVSDPESLTTSSRLPDITASSSAHPFVELLSLHTLEHRQVESSEITDPATKTNHDGGIPAAANDSSDTPKSGSLHANHTTRVDGSSHATPEDVPSHAQKKLSELFSPVLLSLLTDKPAKSAPLSPGARTNTLIPAPPSRRAPALAPLASHVLKREIAERSQGLHPRLVFGKTKIDPSSRPPKAPKADKENQLPPAKTLRKKKGMVFVERMQPAAVSAPSPQHKRLSSTSESRPHNKSQTATVQSSKAAVTSSTIAAPLTPQAKSSRRQSLIPVFLSRSPLSPQNKMSTLPQSNRSTPPTPSVAKSIATPTKRSIRSPRRITKTGTHAP